MDKLDEEWVKTLKLLFTNYNFDDLCCSYHELHKKYRDALTQLDSQNNKWKVNQSDNAEHSITINGKNGFMIDEESYKKGFKKGYGKGHDDGYKKGYLKDMSADHE